MNRTERSFLNLFRAVLHEEKPADPGLSPEEWYALLRLAEAHKLLPLILDAACVLPSCRAALRPAGTPAAAHWVRHASPASEKRPDSEPLSPPSPDWKAAVLEQIARQALQENEFLNLILALRESGLEPVSMKGPVCRALYPKPLLRPSVDDDLLIPDEQAAAYHAGLLEFGMIADEPDADPDKAYELSYHKPASPLYIELHKCLFDPESDAYGSLNEPFEGAIERAVTIQIQDVTLKTLAPTDHLLFLILHAFKHFLHSGFGLRIVADICLYTVHYGEEIDFARIRDFCAERRCDRFAAAVYRIGEKYLGLPAPRAFAELSVDETALLADVLDAGLHGAEIDRLHSANITMNAVKSQKEGTKASGSLRNTVFLPADKLSGRYPYLKKCPWLLPAAWVARVFGYLTDRRHGKQDPKNSIRIGKDRVRLLAEYGVIDS